MLYLPRGQLRACRKSTRTMALPQSKVAPLTVLLRGRQGVGLWSVGGKPSSSPEGCGTSLAHGQGRKGEHGGCRE